MELPLFCPQASGPSLGTSAAPRVVARPVLCLLLAMAAVALVACGPGEEDVRQLHQDVQLGGGDVFTSDAIVGDSKQTGTATALCNVAQDCVAFASAGPPCTYAVCQVGHCVSKTSADGDDCEDGSACTLGDRCLGGSCQPGASKSCDDGNPCTERTCEPVGGACATTVTEVACDSGSPCSVGVCAGGACNVASIHLVVDLPGAVTTGDAQAPLWGVRGPSRLLLGVGAVGANADALTMLNLAGDVVAQLPLDATRAMAATADSEGFIVVGSDGADATSSAASQVLVPGQGIAMSIDAQGNVLWRAAYGTPLDDRLDAVGARADGSFVAVGTRKLGGAADDGAVAPAEGWFVAFGPSGNQLADFYYAGPTETRLYDVDTLGVDALIGGSQRTSNGLALRPLLLRVGVDGSLQSIGQPKVSGRVIRLQRRADGVVAALVAGIDGAAPTLLLFDAAWLQIASFALDQQPGLRAFDARWRPDGSVLVVGGHPEAAIGGAPASIGWLGLMGPWGTLQFSRPIVPLLDVRALLADDQALWLAGQASASDDGGAGPARVVRVDPWGFASCAAAGGCASLGAGCEDQDPCTVDSCDSALGCQHGAVPDATPCGIAKTCVQGACVGG